MNLLSQESHIARQYSMYSSFDEFFFFISRLLTEIVMMDRFDFSPLFLLVFLSIANH
jgi:hypothetical protein